MLTLHERLLPFTGNTTGLLLQLCLSCITSFNIGRCHWNLQCAFWRSCKCKVLLRGQWGWTCRIVHSSTLMSMVAQGCVLALHLYVPTDTPVLDVCLSHTVSKKILDPTGSGWVHMIIWCVRCGQCFFPWHWGCVKRSMKGDKLANRFEARVIPGCWFFHFFLSASRHQHFSRLSLLLPCRC